MTDLRTPENMQPDEVVGEEELVPADDAIIGRAFRWSLLVFVAAGAVIAGMVLLMKRPANVAVAAPREYVPPKRIESSVVAPSIPFTDITQAAGIDFTHVNGATGDKLLPETMGGGTAFLDIDNDGDQDILLINSCDWNRTQLPSAVSGVDATTPTTPAPTHALYRNNGDGTFADVTQGSGFDQAYYGMGVAVGDVDNDGLADVYISALGPNHLYRNLGGGKFEDVTARAGVAGDSGAWSTSAGFVDIDNDGDLDLFVCDYVRWSRDIDFQINYTLTGVGRAYGPPTNFEGANSSLYRNNGDGTFTDITEPAGIRVNSIEGRPMGKALGLAPYDVDGDGLMDLFIANDTVRRFWFHNLGGGKFEERGSESGLAFDRAGNATGAMGVDAARYRNDDTLGFVVGNFANEMSSLMVSSDPTAGRGTKSQEQAGAVPQFVDEAITEGIGAPTRLKLKFGAFFFDADLDGRLDILHSNGHIEDEIHKTEASQTYAQSAQLFWNAGPDAPACFVEATAGTLGDLSHPIVGRGAAYADIDNDGDLDVLLTQVHGRPMLLRNDTIGTHASGGAAINPSDASAGGAASGGAMRGGGPHWMRVKLVGNGTSSNRDAIGATVELAADGVIQHRTVMPTRSYLSQVELPITFGLGDATALDSLTITWPDGTHTTHPVEGVDQLLTIRQP